MPGTLADSRAEKSRENSPALLLWRPFKPGKSSASVPGAKTGGDQAVLRVSSAGIRFLTLRKPETVEIQNPAQRREGAKEMDVL